MIIFWLEALTGKVSREKGRLDVVGGEAISARALFVEAFANSRYN
jgi:hypothetical protein